MTRCELCQWEDTDRCDTCPEMDKIEKRLDEILDREEQRKRGDAIDQGRTEADLLSK